MKKMKNNDINKKSQENAKERESKPEQTEKKEIPKNEGLIPEHEKIFKTTLLIMASFIVLFFVVMYLYSHSNDFSYKNVHFTRVKQGRLIFYKTTYPLYANGQKIANFDLFLRTEPQKLGENVPFKGNFEFKRNMVLNMTGDFNCQGDGVIAVANLVRFLNSAGTKVIRDENASCDPYVRYVYLNIKPGNKTEVIENSPACYEITINGCQILQGTERFILEGLVKLNEVKLQDNN